ncbi:MAG: lysophospholipid acyltransferase family protein [Prolixibacteraceae bacterium]|nr:lysophospholipid acyltransferase family protein [Prolixibacteraceae bacterium]
MEFVNPKAFIQTQPQLKFFGGQAFTGFLMHLLRMKKVNKLYTELAREKGLDFIDKLIETLDIRFEFDENQLKKIPLKGPFITISNHPYGGLDGILLIKLLSKVRPDVKILANSLLQKIDPLQDFFIGIQPFDQKNSDRTGLKQVITHLRNNGVLGVFPAGEASGYDQYYNVADKEWEFMVIKLIKKANVPVVPIYFSGSNSRLYHILGMINPVLSSIKLPSELFKKKKNVSIRIGSAIKAAELNQFSDIHQTGRFLRAKTYCLGASQQLEIKKFFHIPNFMKKETVEAIIPAIDPDKMLHEINSVKSEALLFNVKNYSVYCAPSKKIPNILNEIGRLREITFRQVGEGTNKAVDLDEYDLYYNHLFIWDNEANCIVGAYRIGMGDDIVKQFGLHGLYIKSLFKIHPKMTSTFSEALELGRSFVVQEYQRKPLPLFLLWKGILYFLLKNPKYRYLTGPVSISNNYSTASKESIIKFITTYYFNNDLARYIRPRKGYRFVSQNENINMLLDHAGDDLNKFDRMIGDIDKVNSGIPVLLKKYLSLNAKILAFNVDPNFNNCLDGLIMLDIYDVPQETIESLSKEFNDGSILERFYSSRELLKQQ